MLHLPKTMAAQHLGSVSLYACNKKSPHRLELKNSGCQIHIVSGLWPAISHLKQRPALQNPTHLLHGLGELHGRFTPCGFVPVLMCGASLGWTASHTLLWVRKRAWVSPKGFSCSREKRDTAQGNTAGTRSLEAHSTAPPRHPPCIYVSHPPGLETWELKSVRSNQQSEAILENKAH